jgi:transposase
MLVNHRGLRVFLYRSPIDMRGGFEKLSFLVRELGQDLMEGHLYLFLGKNRRRAKVLFFDGTGLVLIHKRLETGRFLKAGDWQGGEMTTADLSLLLDGSHLKVSASPPPLQVKKSDFSSE